MVIPLVCYGVVQKEKPAEAGLFDVRDEGIGI
jgi:hypothetical protein